MNQTTFMHLQIQLNNKNIEEQVHANVNQFATRDHMNHVYNINIFPNYSWSIQILLYFVFHFYYYYLFF